MAANSFLRDLDYSHENSLERDAILSYVFFPKEIIEITGIGEQFKGRDKILVLEDGRRITVEEKERRKYYSDFLIEGFSTFYGNGDPRNIPGWIEKEGSDWFFYYIAPTKSGYLLPFPLLQRTWHKNRLDWYNNGTIREKEKVEKNGRRIMNYAIKIPKLIQAMKKEGMSSDYSGVVWTFV